MNHFLKTVITEEVEVIMEEVLTIFPTPGPGGGRHLVIHQLDIEGLLTEVRRITGKDRKALAFNKNDLQVIFLREDILKTMNTMAYWVLLQINHT
jgi:hypothetical protein